MERFSAPLRLVPCDDAQEGEFEGYASVFNHPVESYTPTIIEPGTFNWTSKRLYMDVVGEYYFWKRIGFFYNFRNIGNATEDVKIYGPSTPAVARFRARNDYASLWTFGLKGTF